MLAKSEFALDSGDHVRAEPHSDFLIHALVITCCPRLYTTSRRASTDDLKVYLIAILKHLGDFVRPCNKLAKRPMPQAAGRDLNLGLGAALREVGRLP